MKGTAIIEPVVGDVCPKRFGLNYDPPAIVLEYLQVSTGKLFHRRIGLRRLRATSDPARVAEKLRQKNRALLTEDRVSFEQIVSLVTRLQAGINHPGQDPQHQVGINHPGQEALTGDGAAAKVESQPAGDKGLAKVDYHTANLNKLTPEEVLKHKAQMDVMFFKNQKKPGDLGFQYDVQVDFAPDESAENDWDSDEDLDTSNSNEA